MSWAAFGLVVGDIAGAVKGGGWVGLAGGALLVGLVWGLFAGALYRLWAGRAVSARRLNGIANLFRIGTSNVLAWVDGAATPDDLRPPAAPGGQQLVLRLVGRPGGRYWRSGGRRLYGSAHPIGSGGARRPDATYEVDLGRSMGWSAATGLIVILAGTHRVHNSSVNDWD